MGVHFKLKTDVGNVSTICEALEVAAYGKVTGTSSLRQVQKYDSYTAILEKSKYLYVCKTADVVWLFVYILKIFNVWHEMT